jgi:hypothetical protein
MAIFDLPPSHSRITFTYVSVSSPNIKIKNKNKEKLDSSKNNAKAESHSLPFKIFPFPFHPSLFAFLLYLHVTRSLVHIYIFTLLSSVQTNLFLPFDREPTNQRILPKSFKHLFPPFFAHLFLCDLHL